MYVGTYSIDDVVKYFPRLSSNLNYVISQSETYGRDAPNWPSEYTGHIKNSTIYSASNYQNEATRTYYLAELFLKPIRPQTQFINTTDQIQQIIEETFLSVTGKKLPKNLSIQVCSIEELKQIHSRFGFWNDNIQGFALNNKRLKQIFIKNAHLDALMLTMGHEIGHIYTKPLPNSHDEEAKAFSFAVEWARAIRENNIGNLKGSIEENIDFNPAKNGLHDLAFFFVKNLTDKGVKPMQVHWDLVNKYISLFGFYG
jgi:hypothetical protein